ncbi:hypothetical protein ACLIIZ_17745 [Azonexus caeni]|jgi:hypothetical protein|uniref:hypothetical protein n=1 Tax=Azonexus caeni TaxID=266126 RepID=UPI003A8B5647
MKPYLGARILGGLMALVMLGIVLLSSGDNVAGIYLAVGVAMVVLAPLGLIALLMSILYLRRRAPAKAYWSIWGPPLAVLACLWLYDLFDEIRRHRFHQAHPNIEEVHINLSGRSLWLDPETTSGSSTFSGELPGAQPENFARLTRYVWNNDDLDRLWPYAGSRLAPNFNSLAVHYGHPGNTPATRLPALVATPYPEFSKLFKGRQPSASDEAALLTYLYFHYADRVEVTPALRLSGSQEMDFWGRKIPLVAFHLANLHALPLARLEIDGQAVALGDHAFTSESPDDACTSRNYSTFAINELNGPLRVRWQFAEANPRWHEALAQVPKSSKPYRPAGRAHLTDVTLYFQDDGSIVAERSLEIDQAQQRLTLLTTGPGQPLRRPAPCGAAADRYTDEVEIRRDPPRP